MDDLLKLLILWVQYWKTKRGLIGVAVLTFVFFAFVLFPGLSSLDVNPPSAFKIYTIFIVELIWLIIWLIKSYRLPFFGRRLRVAVCLEGTDSTESDKDEIQKQVLKQAGNWEIGDRIKFVKLPKDVKFMSSKEAEKYVWKRNLDLLIWGMLEKEMWKHRR